jgi:holo-[acyl-carrier protein] synthase
MQVDLQMKKAYIGIDIIEIDRIRRATSRWEDHFLQRIYTDAELLLCRNKTESLAGRFAGKEAAMKALNISGWGVSWREIEIVSEADGKPVINLYGRAKARARRMGLSGLDISLSHSRDNAIAMVIGVREEKYETPF